MDAWWPKLLTAEFQPAVGPSGLTAVKGMIGFGDTSFELGWWGYVSKDLRRLYGSGH
jgi:hypothetical protein